MSMQLSYGFKVNTRKQYLHQLTGMLNSTRSVHLYTGERDKFVPNHVYSLILAKTCLTCFVKFLLHATFMSGLGQLRRMVCCTCAMPMSILNSLPVALGQLIPEHINSKGSDRQSTLQSTHRLSINQIYDKCCHHSPQKYSSQYISCTVTLYKFTEKNADNTLSLLYDHFITRKS